MARSNLTPYDNDLERHPDRYEERIIHAVIRHPPRNLWDTEEETRVHVRQEGQHIADTLARLQHINRVAIDAVANPNEESIVDRLPVPVESSDDEMASWDSTTTIDPLESSGDGITDSKRLMTKGEIIDIANSYDSWREDHAQTKETFEFADKYLQKYGPHPAIRPGMIRSHYLGVSSSSSSSSSAQDGNDEAEVQEQQEYIIPHVTISEERLRQERRKDPAPEKLEEQEQEARNKNKKSYYANRRRCD